jgi:4-aminobutyrate aminotransferase-like enzyme
MDAAWPASRGEAIHTSTFLGHPVGCAMALAQIKEIERLNLCKRSAELGEFLLSQLNSKFEIRNSKFRVRGLGLMAGIELRLPDDRPATDATMQAIKAMLQRGYILLPEGEHGNVISFTPPLIISKVQLQQTVKTLAEVLK